MAEVMDLEMEATDLGEAEQEHEQEQGTQEESLEQETPAEEDQQEEAEAETEEEVAAEEETKAEPTAQDGRNLPDAAKKGLALLKKSNPEAAKYFRAMHFQNADYKAAFPTPADATALKAKYDEIGGDEGIAAIAEERQEWGEVDKAVEEGRAGELLAANPEVLAKNAVSVVNEWAKASPDQYGYYSNKVAVNTMTGIGLPSDLSSTHQAMAQFVQQNPDLKPYLQPFMDKIAGAHDKIVDLHEKALQFEAKRTDPKEEKLKQDREQFEQQRRGDFESQVYSDATSYLSTAVDKAIGALLNGRKADPDQMDIYREKVTAEVEKRLAKVSGFSDKLEAHYRTGNRQDSAAYIKRQYDAILGAGKAASVIDPLLRNINQKREVAKAPEGKAAQGAKESSQSGTIQLNDMPDWNRVDWNRTTSVEYAQGRAVLVNGKQARW